MSRNAFEVRHKCLKLVCGILMDINYGCMYVPVNCMTVPKVNKFMNCLNGLKYIRAYYNNVSFVFTNNKNFYEELIPISLSLQFEYLIMISRKKTIVCMGKEVNKEYRLGGCSVDITDGN